MTRSQRLTFLGLAALVAVVAVVVLVVTGGGSDSGSGTPAGSASPSSGSGGANGTATPGGARPRATATATPRPVVLRAGRVQRITVTQGDTVRFEVRNPAPEEVHVHGYDLKQNVDAGRPARFAFKATITGRFDIELEHAGEQIGELQVNPR